MSSPERLRKRLTEESRFDFLHMLKSRSTSRHRWVVPMQKNNLEKVVTIIPLRGCRGKAEEQIVTIGVAPRV